MGTDKEEGAGAVADEVMAHEVPYPALLKRRSQLQAPDFSSEEEVFSLEHTSRLLDMPLCSVPFWILVMLLLLQGKPKEMSFASDLFRVSRNFSCTHLAAQEPPAQQKILWTGLRCKFCSDRQSGLPTGGN